MTDASEILHSFTAEVSEEQNLPHLRQSNITPTASEAMRYSFIINFKIHRVPLFSVLAVNEKLNKQKIYCDRDTCRGDPSILSELNQKKVFS